MNRPNLVAPPRASTWYYHLGGTQEYSAEDSCLCVTAGEVLCARAFAQVREAQVFARRYHIDTSLSRKSGGFDIVHSIDTYNTELHLTRKAGPG